MSIKTLLQIILFLLIILIIGGIYFLYFYKGPISNKLIIQENTIKKETSNKKKNNDQIENLTKEIEYITSNNTGDIYKISAKFGKTNVKDNNILDLDQVNGTISSTKRSKIFISSNFAEYNYTNQDSKFYTDVEIKYDNNIIICDTLEIKMSKNIAIAYGNVLLKNEKSEMKAQVITLDLITKDININSNENISLITN